ncbi:MAG: PEGA domain-containing protein [Clostridia bacterium]|jgi:hypothetical protein|nr:PEGA domain-containing protein [Clostridia bacterium]
MSDRKNKDVSFVKVMLAILALGIILASVAFVVVYLAITSKKPAFESNNDTNGTVIESNVGKEYLKGVVKAINRDESTIMFLNEEGEEVVLEVDGTTRISNESGSAITPTTLKVGDGVLVRYMGEKSIATGIKLDPEIFEQVEVDMDEFDRDAKTITVGSSFFTYDDSTIFVKDEEEVSEDEVLEVDEVNLKIRGKKIVSLTVVKTHGFVKFENIADFEGKEVEFSYLDGVVKSRKYFKISEDESYALRVGRYKVVIQAEGKEVYLNPDFVVTEEEDQNIDLAEVKTKISTVVVDVNVKDFQMTIMNEQTGTDLIVTEDSAIELPYGDYIVAVMKNEYVMYNKELKVDNDTELLNINMQKEKSLIDVKIQTNPSGAEIYIDGDYIGETPKIEKLSLGAHKLKIKKDGFLSITESIKVLEDTNKIFRTLHTKTSDMDDNDIDTPVEDIY